MNAKVAIITSTFLKNYIDEVLELVPDRKEFEIFCYTDFNHLITLYQSISPYIKGIVTSGSFPGRILELTYPESNRIIRPFNIDNTGIYKLLLSLLNENRSFQFHRVYADVFDIAGVEPKDYENYIFGSYEANLSDAQHQHISELSLDELLASEESFAKKHLEMWNRKEIDFSITRFSSIVEYLKQAGVQVHFAYPDVFFVKNVLLSTLKDVTIHELTENMPCSIFVSIKRSGGTTKSEEIMKILHRSLKSFCIQMNMNYHIQQKQLGFEIFTTKEAAKRITEDFTVCKLQPFLKDKISFDLQIGYGLGPNLYQARIHASDANSEAWQLSKSCLINEYNQLLAPLSAKKTLTISRNHSELVKDISKSSGLSCLTVQKIMSVINTLSTEYITSDLLSEHLSISKRSANRFLSALKKSNLAYIVEKKQATSKGRPEYVYKVSWDS